MPWQLALVISTVAAITTKLLQRQYAQTSTAPQTFPMLASYIFGVMPIGMVAGLLFFPHRITWNAWLVMLLLIEGMAMAISTWSAFQASRKLSIAPNQSIGRITTVSTILLAWLVLGEKLSPYQIAGAIILMIGAMIAIWAPAYAKTKRLDQIPPKTLFLAILSAITLAIGLVTEKAVLGHVEVGAIFIVGWGAQTIAMIILAAKDFKWQKLQTFAKSELKFASLMGLANGATGVFYVYALSVADNISLITALTSITVPLTVLGAYIFLKEREHHFLMWLSLFVSVVGLVVISV